MIKSRLAVATRHVYEVLQGKMATNNNVAAPSGGLDGLLHQLDLSMFEFMLCVGFWLAFLVVSSFISLNMILGNDCHRSSRICVPSAHTDIDPAFDGCLAEFPPVAFTLASLNAFSEYLPTLTAVAMLVGMLILLVVYRNLVGKSLIFLLRKLTGSKRR